MMSNGPYGIRDIKRALLGTGVELEKYELQDAISLESLSPGSYVFGSTCHMIGACVREDHSVEVHDNLSFTKAARFSPSRYSCAYKLFMTNCFDDGAKREPREVVGKLVSFPWSVHKLLGHANEDAQRCLEAMSSGPYRLSDIEASLKETGVSLVQQNLEELLQESLLPGNYLFGRRGGHVIGLCVREDHSLEVHDKGCPGGIGHFSPASYYCAWRLLSS